MQATKWMALPEGTKVRVIANTTLHGFHIWDIAYSKYDIDATKKKFSLFRNKDVGEWTLIDSEWELVEEPKLPTQWEMIEVRTPKWSSSWKKEIFVCMYEWQAITHCWDKDFCAWDEWRYPQKETVTLKNGKTYFVEERDDEMVLILKD